MACSTCDDYELVPGDDGMLVTCPDCHTDEPLAWCPVHSVRVGADLRCRKCVAEATRGAAMLLARAARLAAA